MAIAPLLRASVAVSCVALAFAACGGTVVFDGSEGTGGDGGNGDGGSPSTSKGPATSNVGTSGGPIGTGSGPNTSVGPVSAGGGVDEGTSVGPGNGGAGPGQGPGPGPGPGAGGADPGPGPSGVGGADVGPSGSVTVTSGGDCSERREETLQYCYDLEACDFYQLEIECEISGASPYSCWCYENGQFAGQCQQSDSGCDIYGGCCGAFWKLPG